MSLDHSFLNKEMFLKHGFIIQKPNGHYIVGQGPFTFGKKAKALSIYLSDFFLQKEKPWAQSSQVCTLTAKDFHNFLDELKHETTCFDSFFSRSQKPNFTSYQECFIQAKQALSQGDFQKVVSVFPEIFLGQKPILNCLKNIVKNTGSLNGFLYGFWNKGSGFLGFTPEFLFQVQGKEFLSMALAGTGHQTEGCLLKDSKELKEHDFVVKGIKENLKNWLIWKSEKKYEMSFPPLKHIKTDLKGELLKVFDFEAIVKTLHPSSAVGGYPKNSALNWLKSQRSQKNRGHFSAPFGFFESANKAFCLVCLRVLEWSPKESRILSGSGWILESQLEKEWRELKLKREQVKLFLS